MKTSEERRAYYREWYRRRAADPAYREVCRLRNREFVQRHRDAPTNRLKNMLHSARYRAQQKGLAFDLTVADLELPERCPVLGVLLGFGKETPLPNRMSLDRVVPARGYVRGNVRVISHRANSLKSNATADELRMLLAYVERETANLEAPTAV